MAPDTPGPQHGHASMQFPPGSPPMTQQAHWSWDGHGQGLGVVPPKVGGFQDEPQELGGGERTYVAELDAGPHSPKETPPGNR